MNACLVAAGVGVLLTGLAGCAQAVEGRAQRDLESVARGWSAMLRASQVLPVYPLTQDVRPGDVFLVQTPVREQEQRFRSGWGVGDAGYLPLEMHLKRLETPIAIGAGGRPDASQIFAAAFPTYSFRAGASGAASAGLPLSSVPLGLSLLGAATAEGTVTLESAETWGADIAALHPIVEAWAQSAEGLALLEEFRLRDDDDRAADGEPHANFLRVVTRVFTVGGVTVSLTADRSTGAEAQAPIPQAPAANARFSGGVKLEGSSARAVALRETFDRPLVVGYLAYDAAIGPRGELGPIIPTWRVLDAGLAPRPPLTRGPEDVAYAALLDALAALGRPAGPIFVDAAERAAAAGHFGQALRDRVAAAGDTGQPLAAAWRSGVSAALIDAPSPRERRARLEVLQRTLVDAAAEAELEPSPE